MFKAFQLYRECLKEWHTALDGGFSGCSTVSRIKNRHIYVHCIREYDSLLIQRF